MQTPTHQKALQLRPFCPNSAAFWIEFAPSKASALSRRRSSKDLTRLIPPTVQSANDVIMVALRRNFCSKHSSCCFSRESDNKSKNKSYFSVSISPSLRRVKSDSCKSGLCKVLHYSCVSWSGRSTGVSKSRRPLLTRIPGPIQAANEINSLCLIQDKVWSLQWWFSPLWP